MAENDEIVIKNNEFAAALYTALIGIFALALLTTSSVGYFALEYENLDAIPAVADTIVFSSLGGMIIGFFIDPISKKLKDEFKMDDING